MKFCLLVLLALSTSAYAKDKCKVYVKETVRMPNGPEMLPSSNLNVLKTKGYVAVISNYQTPKRGEYSLNVEVRCATSVFNPWLSSCDTRAILKNSDAESVAEGISTNTMNLGVFTADVKGAFRDLPDCSQI